MLPKELSATSQPIEVKRHHAVPADWWERYSDPSQPVNVEAVLEAAFLDVLDQATALLSERAREGLKVDRERLMQAGTAASLAAVLGKQALEAYAEGRIAAAVDSIRTAMQVVENAR